MHLPALLYLNYKTGGQVFTYNYLPKKKSGASEKTPAAAAVYFGKKSSIIELFFKSKSGNEVFLLPEGRN